MISTPHGLRVLGSLDNPRWLVDYRETFVGYCRAYPKLRLDVPGYLSLLSYPGAFREYIETKQSTGLYRGPVGVPKIAWDIDRAGNLDAALRDCRRLAAYLADRYALDDSDLLIGFSGQKGFHVELPVGWTIEPAVDANGIARVFAERAAREVGIQIDRGVYDRVRLFRAWNTLHPKTGLFKIRIGLDDMLHASLTWIAQRAVQPIGFEPPAGSSSPSLLAAWSEAEQAVRQPVEKRPAGPTDAAINALTRELILNPVEVEVGERHRRLFSAAANLAEFANIDDLIKTLLTEPGLDTGLPPAEVERQIRTGIEHARRQRAEGGAVDG
jgi:hypothetical protein